ncbi:MAG: NAD(P)/FAD-dependent oxidoreductase [Clostridia bacterium]|nr:NAD(P)/FAD-dependent oxidoreductase [Clostridia bacterium]
MAAGTAAKNGNNVTLIEKNDIVGKKLLITGRGRCNITNACEDVEELINNVTTNGSFMYSAFYGFTNHDTIEFFNSIGVKTKVERGNRVFPESDKSKTVADALENWVKKCGVKIVFDTVLDLISEKDMVKGVILKNRGKLFSDSVIIATGGVSYPKTGSTGDGYKWAKKLGHTIVEPKPSLAPLDTKEEWSFKLAGLSLKNISIKFFNEKNKKVYEDFGEMMFTHTGLTGPVVLSASANLQPMESEKYRAEIDLKPALSEKQLDERIQRDFAKNLNKNLDNALDELLPKNLIAPIISLSGLDGKKKVNSVTKEERRILMENIKHLKFTILDFGPIDQAIVTSGGISVNEIDPGTMESKVVKNLYFAGEVIDVDAYTGGFNLQVAFSTGYVAGSSV